MRPGKKAIRVAAAQIPAVTLDQTAHAWALIETAVRDARAADAELLVLPECSYPAYLLGSAEGYRASRHDSSAAFIDRLRRLAREAGLHVICGYVEESGTRLYNAACVIESHGKCLGSVRKSFLWGEDQDYFSPGETIEVIETALGRIGIAICADLRSPEILASLADQGAELIAVPTCWVMRAQRSRDGWPSPQPEVLVPARAREFGLPLVCANKVGREREDITYCGLSRVVNAEGGVLAEADEHESKLIVATIERGQPPKRVIPTWAAARILTPEPAIVPPEGEQEMFKLCLVPESLIDRKKGRLADDAVLDFILEQEAEVLVAHVSSAAKAQHFELQMRAMGLTAITSPSDYRVMYDWFGSYGCLSGPTALSFAPVRALALDGAALLVAFDTPDDEILLRARALENRCFLAATSEKGAVCIDPDGHILAKSAAGEVKPVTVTINLAEASNKLVFDRTHIWEQRRPAIYAAATHMGLDV